MAAVMHEDRPPPPATVMAAEMAPHTVQPESAPNGQSLSMDLDSRSGPKTPTRDSFSSQTVAAESSSAIAAHDNPQTSPKKVARQRTDSIGRTESLRSHRSRESGDIDMDDDEDLSDNDSVTSDAGRPSKKKKGQRFFCTDFPPCTLSFTRSEHLARHIRKHTGERPFQCHCLRRFSRLDNLRQHAQTVHVNEEIPGDSLAATGTRFQRQIRTDRMRTPGHRARASTISSTTVGHTRGHSRNYSGSSIGSISDIGSPDDGRRRPQPLAMAQTPTRNGLLVDPYTANSGGGDHNYTYYSQSPSTYNSPSMFSRELGSPGSIGHPMQSPLAMTPRVLTWGERTPNPPNRRLSVPSGSPMMHSSTAPYGSGYMSPVASSHASTYSNNSSMVQSPTSSVFSHDRRESASEAEIRRRTWHPSTVSYTSRPATSGLSYYQTPDAPQPTAAPQPAAAQSVRLPGIDSFDRATERPDAPPRRALSPMEVDTPSRQGTNSSAASTFGNALGISEQRDSQQGRQYESPHSRPASYGGEWQQSSKRPYTAPHPQDQESRDLPPPPVPAPSNAPSGPSVDAPFTPRQRKRQGWYNGPLPGAQDQPGTQPQRTSPEGSSSSDGVPTPSYSNADYHPTIIHSNGEIEPPHHGVALEDHQKNNSVAEPSRHFRNHVSTVRPSGDMDRLDALVAVATSENRAVENR